MRFRFCAFIAGCSSENPRKSARKSKKNRSKIDLGRFWAILVAQGRLRDAFGRVQDLSRTAPGRRWDGLGASKSDQIHAKSGPGVVLDRPRASRERARARLRRPTRREASSHRIFVVFRLARTRQGENAVFALTGGMTAFLRGLMRLQTCAHGSHERPPKRRKSTRFGLQNRVRTPWIER